MNMMSEMFADMLKKAIPPEVAEMLTPEKMKEFGDKANAFIVDFKARIERIEENQLAHGAILEALQNDRCNYSVKRTGKLPASNGSDIATTDIG